MLTSLQAYEGEEHVAMVRSDGTVRTWGHNDYGQLGDNSTTNRLTPVQVCGLTGVTAITAAGCHSLYDNADERHGLTEIR